MNTIGEAASFLSGGTPKKSNPEFWEGNIPWFSASNMSRKFLTNSNMNISEKGLLSGSRMAPKGSTLLLVRGSGLFNHIPICFTDYDVAFNQDVKAIVPKNGIDPLYLHYTMEAHRQKLTNNLDVTGIGAGKFDTDFVKKLPFILIEHDEQVKIGKLASAYDRKIELNRQMNETLEAMARALFKDWFVDFGPTRRQMEGATDPTAIMGKAFPPEKATKIAPLFPSKFGDDGLPIGWKMTRTEDLAEKIAMGPFGSNIKVSTFVDYGVPIISGHHLHNTIVMKGKHKFITVDHADKLANSNVFSGDIIFTHAGTIKQVAMITPSDEFERYVISQRQFFLRPNKAKVSPFFLLIYFKSPIGQHELLSNASQVGVPSIARPSSHLKGIEICTPDSETMTAFEEIASSLYSKVIANEEQTQTLTKMRDLLLPKLMSGEIRLKDMEEPS